MAKKSIQKTFAQKKILAEKQSLNRQNIIHDCA